MEWSKKRKLYYIAALIGVLIIMLLPVMYLALYREPTCFDGVQNGSELGIDCGGSCTRYCSFEMKPLRVVWVKPFLFAPEHYDIGAYVENPNQNAGIPAVGYTVRAFNESGQMIAERSGTTGVAPGVPALIFEGNFFSTSIPARAEIEFKKGYESTWQKARRAEARLVTKNYTLRFTEAGPRFEATIVNTDPVVSVGRTVVGAIIADSMRNPIAISRTIIDGIAKGGEYPVLFTWPERFPGVLEGDKLITDVVITQPAVFQNEQ